MRSVELHDVSKFYGSLPVVNGVSLRVADGEFVTLLGPSGCGKTTTLRLIAGLAAPDRGRIEIGGSDVTHTPIHRRNVGMVFQSHALFPHMTIAENVGFGLKMRGVGRAERTSRIREALKLVRLGNLESDSRPIVGRATAADRPCPRVGLQSSGFATRRTVRGARS